MIMISNFLFNFTNFCVIVSFLTKLLTLGISLSIAVRTVVVAKLLILGISHLTSFILALRIVLVARSVMLVILSSILYTSFLTASFLLHHLV